MPFLRFQPADAKQGQAVMLFCGCTRLKDIRVNTTVNDKCFFGRYRTVELL